jgi:ABC-type transport system substrate-binding protein
LHRLISNPEKSVKSKYNKEEKVMKKVLILALAIIVIGSLLIGGCGEEEPTPTKPAEPAKPAEPTKPAEPAKPAEASKYGGTLIVGAAASSEAFGYPPLIAYGAHTAAGPAIEYLFDFDVNGNFKPKLAKDYEIDVEGKTFTIYLREGVRFHDGTDCDAEAIKWNMEQFAVAQVPMLTSVTSIDVVDKWTVRLNLSSFSNSLIYDLVLAGGMPISPTAAEKNGTEWTYTHPVGTGPFKLESFQRDVSLKYVKNEDYWDEGKPYLDALEFHYIADSVTREMALKSGEVHVLVGYELSSHADLKAAGFSMKKAPLGVYNLYPDSKNADSIFAVKEVREAVEYAIDKQAIVDALGYGIWESAYQEVASFRMGYCPDIQPRLYDPAKAKELLEQAGYPNGFKTSLLAQNTTNQDLLASLQSYLADVGITAEIELLDMGKFNDYYYNGWQDGLLYWLTPSEPRSFDALNREFATDSNYSVSVLRPAALGEFLKSGDKETDTSKLAADVQGVVRVLSEETLTIPLMMQYHVGVEKPELRDTGMYDEARCFKVHCTWADAYFAE